MASGNPPTLPSQRQSQSQQTQPPAQGQQAQVQPPAQSQASAPTLIDLDAQRERRQLEREERRRQMRAALTLEQSRTQPHPLRNNRPTTQRRNTVAGLTGINGWIQSQPTPGGIGALVAALFLLMLLIFPVTTANGKKTTRFLLLWNVLTGHAKIQGEESVTASEITSIVSGAKGPVAGNAPLPPTLPPGTQFPTMPPVPTGTLGASPDNSPLDAVGWMPAIP